MDNEIKLRPVQFWQLHKNPILLRYIRSRMRPSKLFTSVILTIVMVTFAGLMSYSSAQQFGDGTQEDAYRAAFLPVFFIQLAIMMLVGTGAVVGGITQEFEDEMIDYQRLTPMRPLAKIVGYLFGLPIREWFLFSLTMVAIAIIVVNGNIPFDSIWKVYSIFFLSIFLYHLLALVVVQSMKRKRLAGRVIQGLVLLLYIVFPFLSQFGFVFFEFITVRPILKEHMLPYLPEREWISKYLSIDGVGEDVMFFNSVIETWNFAAVLQLSLIITLVVILRRRWQDVLSHLMGKPFATLFYGFFMMMLLGNTIPLVKSGDVMYSQKEKKKRIEKLEKYIEPYDRHSTYQKKLRQELKEIQEDTLYMKEELAGFQTLFFTISGLLACLLIYIITPTHNRYLVGLRRSRNSQKKWIPVTWDSASGLLSAILICGLFAIALKMFGEAVFSMRGIPKEMAAYEVYLPGTIVFGVACVLCFYFVYDAWGNKGLFLLILCVWVLPILFALVMSVNGFSPNALVMTSAISPLFAYAYGLLEYGELSNRVAFHISLFIQVFIGLVGLFVAIHKKRELRARLGAEQVQV